MKRLFIFLVMLLLASLCLIGCQQEKKEKPKVAVIKTQTAVPKAMSKVERGKYLVNGVGCADCHSPKIMGPNGPEPDPNRMFMGHPANEKLPKYDTKILKDYALFNMTLTAGIGPWGTSFAANLTPHETGLGSWTEDQFLIAIKQGKYKGQQGGREMLPPMPWQFYRNLSDDDLKAIFAYLKSLKPIENVVPSPIPPTIL